MLRSESLIARGSRRGAYLNELMNDLEPYKYSASAAAAEIAAGKLTAEAYISSCLERIAAREEDVRAWACIDPEFALKQARERDRAPRRGALHGIPVAFKDAFDTVDLATEYNSSIYKGHRPSSDAACVALTKKSGGIVMGKTVTTEFAYRHPGRTRNPHHLAHTPGGSSSGSAAAVADFMVPIALGTQTGGSTIRPASFCGIVGYKPSFGLINRAGLKFVAESLDHVGVLARTVQDVALFTCAVTGIAAPDFKAQPAAAPRIGFCRTRHWNDGDAAMHEKLELAARTLAQTRAVVSEFDLGSEFDSVYDDQPVINMYELARALAYEYENHRDRLSGLILEHLELGWNIPRERYDRAIRNIIRCRLLFENMMQHHDFILTPAAPGEAPQSIEHTGNPIFTRVWTMLGVPCVTVPAYTGAKGLPIGVQIVGGYRTDTQTLAWAEWVLRVLA